ncbi:uncharacterized protein METZ01_LOCUS500819 [marine metagenome]|uniref:Uncharacterized protein n=1 Tax=marine metagenome TaxID=408172 RepID=A0A383DUQ6_9ZZZZ
MGMVKVKKEKNKIKLVNNGGSLSETDLQLIAGTELVEAMMRNRVVVVTNNNDVAWNDLMTDIKGLYHIRPLDKSKQIYQLWFELKDDIDQFNKNLYVSKLSNTAHEPT